MSIDPLLKIVPDKRRLSSCFSKKKQRAHVTCFKDGDNRKYRTRFPERTSLGSGSNTAAPTSISLPNTLPVQFCCHLETSPVIIGSYHDLRCYKHKLNHLNLLQREPILQTALQQCAKYVEHKVLGKKL